MSERVTSSLVTLFSVTNRIIVYNGRNKRSKGILSRDTTEKKEKKHNVDDDDTSKDGFMPPVLLHSWDDGNDRSWCENRDGREEAPAATAATAIQTQHQTKK